MESVVIEKKAQRKKKIMYLGYFKTKFLDKIELFLSSIVNQYKITIFYIISL